MDKREKIYNILKPYSDYICHYPNYVGERYYFNMYLFIDIADDLEEVLNTNCKKIKAVLRFPISGKRSCYGIFFKFLGVILTDKDIIFNIGRNGNRTYFLINLDYGIK